MTTARSHPILRFATTILGVMWLFSLVQASAQTRAGSGPTAWERAAAISCQLGSKQCRVIRPLFACGLEEAASIAAQGVEHGLFLVSRKICSVVPTGTEIEVQPTKEWTVGYVTTQGVHTGYVPYRVAVPDGAFPKLPDVLTGVWLPSLRHCQVYKREGPNEANDGATLFTIRPTEIAGYEIVRLPLLISQVGPQSWRITFHGGGDGDPQLETVTVSLKAGVLSFSDEPTRRIRCVGVMTPAERAHAKEVSAFRPLRLTRDLVTEGRCRMGTCSWARWLSINLVSQSGGELFLRVELIWGTSADESRRQRPITWDRTPRTVQLRCSKSRPAIIDHVEETTLQTTYGSFPGVLESSARLYFAACHSDLNYRSEIAASYGYKLND